MTRLALAAILLAGLAGCTKDCPAPTTPLARAAPPAPAAAPVSSLFPRKDPALIKPPLAAAPRPAVKVVAPKRGKPPPKPRHVKAAALPAWCSRVPSWVSMSRLESEAAARGKPLTPKTRAQAQACLASKKG